MTNQTEPTRLATVTEIWKFFGKSPGCDSLKDFQDEWKALSADDKLFYKTEVAKVV